MRLIPIVFLVQLYTQINQLVIWATGSAPDGQGQCDSSVSLRENRDEPARRLSVAAKDDREFAL